MKKKLSIVLALLLSVLFAVPAFASVGIKIAGVDIGAATDINFPVGTSYAYDGSTLTIPTLATSVSTITSGTINGATIGASSASTGAFTTLAASSTLAVTGISTLTGRLNANGGVDLTSAGALAIGATTATSVTITPATTITGALTETGAATFNGAVTLGDAVTDINTITGKIAGATPLVFDGATANAVYTILAVDDPASSSKTVTLPAVTGTIMLSSAATAITAGATPTVTVTKGNQLFTDTIVTDGQNQSLAFSSGGAAGDVLTIIFVTDTGGSQAEVITLTGTYARSTGTLTLANGTATRYVVQFVSDGTKWNEVSRTAVQAA